MKRNLKNISLCMMLATSPAIYGMVHTFEAPTEKAPTENAEMAKGTTGSGSFIGPKLPTMQERANIAKQSANIAEGASIRAQGAAALTPGQLANYTSGIKAPILTQETISLNEGQATPQPLFEDINGTQNPTQFKPSLSLQLSSAQKTINKAVSKAAQSTSQALSDAAQATGRVLSATGDVIGDATTKVGAIARTSLDSTAQLLSNPRQAIQTAMTDMKNSVQNTMMDMAVNGTSLGNGLSSARQSIRTAAAEANAPEMMDIYTNGKLRGREQIGSNKTLSNLPVRTLDSTLTAISSLPTTARNLATAAKAAVMDFYNSLGRKPTAEEASTINQVVHDAVENNSSNATPQTTYNSVMQRLAQWLTNTTVNSDGSTTTTITNPNGKNPFFSGAKLLVTKKPDGTIITQRFDSKGFLSHSNIFDTKENTVSTATFDQNGKPLQHSIINNNTNETQHTFFNSDGTINTLYETINPELSTSTSVPATVSGTPITIVDEPTPAQVNYNAVVKELNQKFAQNPQSTSQQ